MFVIHGVSKKFVESYHKTKDTNKFSLLPFKIVAFSYNIRLTKFVQLPETISKGILWNRRRMAVTRSLIAFTSAKRAPSMAAFKRGNRKKSARASSREQGGRSTTATIFWARNWRTRIALRAGAVSWKIIHFPVLCNSGRTRRIRCSNRFKTAW